MKNSSAGRKFLLALVLFTILILSLWFGYYIIAYQSVSRSARENAELVAGRLIDQISAEFSQMRNIAGVIAASSYVQDFLSADTVEEYFARAEIASVIIRNAAFPISAADSVITYSANGDFFRFTGSLSNAASEILFDMLHDTGVLFTIIELDGILFFCHSTPVYSVLGNMPDRVGTVVILTNLHRKRDVLNFSDAVTGIDTAVIQDNIILLSSGEELEGKSCCELETAYVMVVRRPIASTNLSIAAIVNNENLFPNRGLFFIISFALLALLLASIVSLYQYLSVYMVKPIDRKLFEAELLRRDMRIGLLISQMDAHFIVNAIETIRTLSKQNENEKAERMAAGLTQLIKHKHTGDALCNIFLELEMIVQYIAVMNIRHDNKYSVEYEVDDVLSAYLMPGLILQPIIENALTHGLQNKTEKAILHIQGYMKDDSIYLEISDNGKGITPTKLNELQNTLDMAEIENFPAPGLSGVSLSNIQRRIRLRFGDNYGLSIESTLGGGTTVTVKLPPTPDGE